MMGGLIEHRDIEWAGRDGGGIGEWKWDFGIRLRALGVV